MKKILVNNDIYLQTHTIEEALGIQKILDTDKDELINIFNFVTPNSNLQDEIDFIKSLKSDKFNFTIFYKGYICGVIGLYDYNETENSYEIFYYISSEFRRLGILKATMKSFISYVFNELKAEEIKFYVNTDNISSNQFLLNIGLEISETIEDRDYCNGKYHTQHLYRLRSKTLKGKKL